MAKVSERSAEGPNGVGAEVLTYIINAVAFKDFRGCCDADAIAEALGKNPMRFRLTLNKLVDAGWLTLEGRDRQRVYPTAAALRWQDPKLTNAAARKLLARLKRA